MVVGLRFVETFLLLYMFVGTFFFFLDEFSCCLVRKIFIRVSDGLFDSNLMWRRRLRIVVGFPSSNPSIEPTSSLLTVQFSQVKKVTARESIV